MSKKTLLTPEQVKQSFRDRGVTFTQWAAERGYSRKDVYRVLNGQLKAHFGRAHEIAVELGLKADLKASTADALSNTHAARAA